jgi:hypothetical protein
MKTDYIILSSTSNVLYVAVKFMFWLPSPVHT